MDTNQNFGGFDAPPADAFSDRVDILRIDYAANKTPESYAHLAQGQILEDAKAAGKLGFSYWKRSEFEGESGQKIALLNFTFYLLEVYSALSGMAGEGANRINYYSNKVKDTRVEPFVLFDGGKEPIRRGLYSEIKGALPQGVGFNLHFIGYCPELDRVIDLKLTASVQRGIVNAIIDSARRAGKTKSAKNVNLFSLADNDHIWGFRQIDFSKECKDGTAYAGKGELYFAPTFVCGIIDPSKPERAEIHRQCCELQAQVRANYEERKKKAATFTGNAGNTANAGNAMPQISAQQPANVAPSNQRSAQAPHNESSFDNGYFPSIADMNTAPSNDDDLPF